MKRRQFLSTLSAALAGAGFMAAQRTSRASPAVTPPSPWRTFEIVTTVDVAVPEGRTLLWLPVPAQRLGHYQRTLHTTWVAAGAQQTQLVALPGDDVQLLCIEWSTPTAVQQVTLTHRVMTRDRHVDLEGNAGGGQRDTAASLKHYLRATALVPTDGIVKDTATRIVRGHRDELSKARAIYEWVVENTTRDPRTPGCGMGDVASMLKSGYLGGKCADINALFVALTRAAQIPARDAYGIRIADSRLGFSCLGRGDDVSKAQHCRAEFYSAAHGWIPVDPADVRKVMLEEPPPGRTLSDAKVQMARTLLFGAWEMNWLAYNHGHDVALPHATSPAMPFLMYPSGETGAGPLDSLSPDRFKYRITSHELTTGNS
jgi:transglutaminase-like putative cysteine protease